MRFTQDYLNKIAHLYMQASLNIWFIDRFMHHKSPLAHQFWVILSERAACWRMLQFCYQTVFTHMLLETGLRYLWPASLSKEPIVRTGTAELSQMCSKDFLASVFTSGSISDGDSVLLAPAILLQAHKLPPAEMDGRGLSARAHASLHCASHPRIHLLPDARIALTTPMRVITHSRDWRSETRGVLSAQYDLKILQPTASTAQPQLRLTSVSEPNHITTSKPRHQADSHILITLNNTAFPVQKSMERWKVKIMGCIWYAF